MTFKSKGFTLIELLVVIAVLGVLAGGVFVAINPLRRINQANDSKIKSDIGQIANAMQAYYVTNQKYPTTVGDLVLSGDLKTEPKDPKGNSYTITAPDGNPCTDPCTDIIIKAPLNAPQTTNGNWQWDSVTGQVGEIASIPTATPQPAVATNTPTPTPVLPSGIANCVVWIKADQGVIKDGANKVSGWTNQCSTSNFSQTNASNGSLQPLYVANAVNNKPAVRFDGSNDYIYAGPSTITAGTTFMVVSWRGTLPTALNYPGPGALDNNTPGVIDGGQYQLSPLGSFPPNNTKNFSPNPINPVNPQTQNIFFKFLLNGAPISGVTNILIGVRDSSGAYWNGDIAEVIIYSRTLTANEIQSVTTYLSTKYGI